MRGTVRVVLGIGLLAGVATSARAQSKPPYDPNTETQLFEYEVGPKTFFAVDDASLAAKKQFAADFMVTFLSNPVTVYTTNQQGTEIQHVRTNVVQTMVAGEASAAYGLTDRYQLGVVLPLVFTESGEGIDVTNAGKGQGLSLSGLGDLRAEIKARIWEKNAMRLAGAVGLTLPTSFGFGDSGQCALDTTTGMCTASSGGTSSYLGDNLPTFRGRIAWNWSQNKLSIGANAGLVLGATRTIYATKVGQQFTYGLAGAYSVTDKFSVVGEWFGRVGMRGLSADTSPMEAEGGVRVVATKAIAVVLGGGAGLVKGIGSPDVRVFASIGYEPDTRDTDGDGIPNNKDKCPLVAEDKDGFEDEDGCPDDDNDHDMRPDAEDKCPNQAEDIDGFQDDDGCPDPDNDGDGVADLQDRCPNDKEDGKGKYPTDGCPIDMRDSDGDGIMDDKDQCPDQAEDMDGFEDWDGCPEADNDHDGIPDDSDKCPLCPEDKDGVQDDDGCPEDDADHDGIPDAQDKCPTEMETINGVDDWDGCPDDGGAVVADFDGDRINFVAPVTFDKKGLTKAGTVILDQAALQILQHGEVTMWTVAVSAKKDADAKKHAAAILRQFQSRGVPLDRMHVVTAAGGDAVGIGVEERSDADPNAPMACPAGMEVQPKPQPAAGAAIPEATTPAPASSTPAPAPATPAPAKPAKP